MRKRIVQPVLLRLDVDVGGAHLRRVLEHRLQQLDDRRVLGARVGAERAEIDGRVAAEILLSSFARPVISSVRR